MPKYLKEFLCTMPKQYRQELLEEARFRCLLSWYMMFVLLCTRETDTQGEPPAGCLNQFGAAKVFLWPAAHHRVVLLTSIVISNSPAPIYCWVCWDHPYTNSWDRLQLMHVG